MSKLRAKSQDEKLVRRQFILKQAEQILRADGFEAFTMSKLADAAGLAKGTLYLYFSGREDLVLSLYTQLNNHWIDHFLAAEKSFTTVCYSDLCDRFYQFFIADDLLVGLAARASFSMEPYVSTPVWVMAKRAFARQAKRLGGMFCRHFNCDPAHGQRLAWAFLTAISGAQQRACELDDRRVMPDDLVKLSLSISRKDLFLNMVLPLSYQLDKKI